MQRFFRYACILILLLQASILLAADDGFKPIFNGKSLDGWDGNPELWHAEDGMIVGQTTAENPLKSNSFLVWRGGKPGDFELKAEFRMPNPGFANSGIQIRSWELPEKWRVCGYQADMEGGDSYTGICYGEGYRGILALRGQKVVIGKDHKPQVAEQFGDAAELGKVVKKNDWNEYHVIAKGNHITHIINGQLMCEVTDEDTEARFEGIIALQLHAGPPMKVQFRNIRLKETPKEAAPAVGANEKKKIVFVAGSPSHGFGEHEYYADSLLWAKWIKEAYPAVETVVNNNGWPTDPKIFDGADAIVVYSDGGEGNPMVAHLDEIQKLMDKGIGLACIHYAVEVPAGKAGDCVKNWIGGFFETFWSVNPGFWVADFKQFPNHPVARGLKPFSFHDEWYFNMRFVDDMKGVTPILTTTPPDSTRHEGNEAHTANEHVRAQKGRAEHLAWVYDRPNGGRGFGFTGGHSHWCMPSQPQIRTLILNGVAWVSHLEVPAAGVPSKAPSLEELDTNMSKAKPANFDREQVRKLIEGLK